MEMTVHGQCYNQQHIELGLGLSLGIAGATATVEAAAPPGQRALATAEPTSTTTARCWNGAGVFFPSSSSGGQQRALADGRRAAACHEMPFLRGIDVNRAPEGGEVRESRCCGSEDEEPGASSPNSTLSSLSGKRGAPARSEQERAGAASDDEDSGAGGACGGGSRKKLRLSKDQSVVLEDSFKEHSTLNPKQKAALARQLGLRPRQVEVWFQNRRARTKLKQTEVDCEALKRCCEALTEENRRLQREVQELRALKLLAPPPHLYMHGPPPTTLIMCPSCECVASSSGKPAAAAAAMPSGPWGPVPVRSVFLDRPAERS